MIADKEKVLYNYDAFSFWFNADTSSIHEYFL